MKGQNLEKNLDLENFRSFDLVFNIRGTEENTP